MLQFYSGSGQGTLRANIMNANNAGVHAALGTGGTVVFGGTCLPRQMRWMIMRKVRLAITLTSGMHWVDYYQHIRRYGPLHKNWQNGFSQRFLRGQFCKFSK